MNKKKAIVSIIVMLAVMGLAAFIVFVGFGSKHTGSAKNIKLGLDLRGGVNITYEVENEKFTDKDFSDTQYKMEQRVYKFSTEAEVNKEGDRRITVAIPGETDANSVLNELGKPGSLYFATREDDSTIADGDKTLQTTDPVDGKKKKFKIWLSGSDIKNAEARTQTDSQTQSKEYTVDLTMTDEGKTKFANATTENVGKSLYIIYDDEVISYPVIKTALKDGQATIDGQKSLEEAENLASNIRIGSLKLTMKEISHKVVTAQLGNDALQKSIIAGIIGLAIVVIFMCIVYRVPGIVSGIALLLYTLMIALTLNGFDLTLTLSGIAGIILSIGMAVDANVIIYARIREEIGKGRNVDTAIKAGFSKATSAIVDGNITTIIAAVVLMWKGSGSVQGFAQTLAIGVVLSMFTALVVSRTLIYAFYALGAKKPGLYGKSVDRKPVDFVSKNKIFISVSVVLILLGCVFMGVQSGKGNGAFNYSIEFQGGKAYTMDFDTNYSIDQFNDDIKPAIAKVINSNDIQGQKDTSSNKITIKTKDIDETTMNSMKKMLVEKYGAKSDTFEEQYISGTVSKEMGQNAIFATILATIFMLLYIWFRFKDIKFAGAAVLALVHDVLIVVAFYAASRTSVGTTFIACLLTLVGYSINGTIVIFDRIRENRKNAGKNADLKEIVNSSITQTLTRSIYTTFTTFITIAMIYVLGVASIKEFALPMMIGIIAGAYSSVCITGGLWYTFEKMGEKRKSKKQAKPATSK